MKIKEYRTQFIQELAPIYDVGEAENFFYLILEEKHKLKRIDLALQPDLVFLEEEIVVWNLILEQLKQEIAARDKADSERAISPLVQAPEAQLLDTTGMTIEQVVNSILNACR